MATDAGVRSAMSDLTRAMVESDLAAVMAIQAARYVPAMVEPVAVIRARLLAARTRAWVVESRRGIGAYLMAYPSRVGSITPLGGGFDACPDADCLYLHDLAVAPWDAGAGLGRCLVETAMAEARRAGLGCLALVSVLNSSGYWRRLGFHDWEVHEPEQRERLLGYAGPAYYMVRALDRAVAPGADV